MFPSKLSSVQEKLATGQVRQRTRVVLLDELLLFRASLSRLLASQPGLLVAGECGDSEEALQLLRTQPADVVLLDLHCAGESAEAFFLKAREAGYGGRFLILTGAVGARESASAIRAGASGIFLKSDASVRLVQAIRLVAAGAVWIDPSILRLMAGRLFDLDRQSEDGAIVQLSDRERSVLMGVVEGLTNRKIGNRLGLSESAIKGSVQLLFQRAGVRTRSQLVRAALEKQLAGPLNRLAAPQSCG